MTLQGQVYRQFWPQKLSLLRDPVTSKGSRTALPTLQKAPHSFSWAACAYGSKLGDSCDTPGASIQAALSAKAVISKGSSPALPTLQRAPHSFSWAACDFRSKLGDSCDTPCKGKYRQFSPPKLSLLRDPGLPSQRSKGPAQLFMGSLRLWGKAWRQL